jgi:hypothetical protein
MNMKIERVRPCNCKHCRPWRASNRVLGYTVAISFVVVLVGIVAAVKR